MWKKIVLYTTFAVVAGLLVLGAVNRTMARTELVSGEGEGGAGRGANRSAVEQGYGHGNGEAGQAAVTVQQGRGENGGGNGNSEAGQAAVTVQQERGGNGGRNGGGNGSTTVDGTESANRNGGRNLQDGGRLGQSAEAPVQAYEWQEVTGEVTQVDGTQMTLLLADGTELLVEGRPWQYAQQAGFQTQPGNRLQVRGYTEDGEFKVGELLNLDGDQVRLQLRDEAGQPAWRGQGAGRSGS